MRTTLGALAEPGGVQTGPFGSQLHAHEYSETGVPVVMPQDLGENVISIESIARVPEEIADRLERHRLTTGDIVYSRRGDITKRAWVLPNQVGWLCGTGCLRVRLNPMLADSRFVSYALGLPETRTWLTNHAVGATMPNLNTAILSEVPVDVPDLATQTAIADILGALDDKIAANQRANSIAMVLSQSLLLEASGSVPLVPLAQLVNVPRKTVTPAQGRVWHFSLPAFDDGGVPKLEDGAEIKSAKQRLERPSVLLSKLNPRIPRVWDVAALPERHPALASTEFIVLEPRSASTAELAAALRLPTSLDGLQSLARGTSGSHQRVSPADAMALEVPDATQLPGALRRTLTVLGAATASRRAESVRLAATRDALLPELMSGRLAVRAFDSRVSV